MPSQASGRWPTRPATRVDRYTRPGRGSGAQPAPAPGAAADPASGAHPPPPAPVPSGAQPAPAPWGAALRRPDAAALRQRLRPPRRRACQRWCSATSPTLLRRPRPARTSCRSPCPARHHVRCPSVTSGSGTPCGTDGGCGRPAASAGSFTRTRSTSERLPTTPAAALSQAASTQASPNCDAQPASPSRVAKNRPCQGTHRSIIPSSNRGAKRETASSGCRGGAVVVVVGQGEDCRQGEL